MDSPAPKERTCRRCGLGHGRFHVRVPRDADCNYCRFWDEHKHRYEDYEQNRRILNDRLDRVRGRYRYDAIVWVF